MFEIISEFHLPVFSHMKIISEENLFLRGPDAFRVTARCK